MNSFGKINLTSAIKHYVRDLLRCGGGLALLALLVCSAPQVWAQQESQPDKDRREQQNDRNQKKEVYPQPISPLALENLKHVAAPVEEIKLVLQKDAGLLVELRYWLAKDATDHGQMVDDADLTTDAIYERLTRDVEFRAATTRLLQRYGYLLPKLIPGSEAEMDQKLLYEQKQLDLQRRYPPETTSPANGQQQGRVTDRTRGTSRTGAGNEPPAAGTGPGLPGSQEIPLDLRSLPLSRATLTVPSAPGEQGSPGATAGQPAMLIGSPTLPRYDDGRASMASELRDRGTGSPAPPDSAVNSRVKRDANAGELSGLEESARKLENESREELANRPAIVRTPNPFATVPSLYDMYRQVSPNPPEPKRFGEDLFLNTEEDTSKLPTDLPAGPNYVVGPGDGLNIDLWGAVSQRISRLVDREGRVSLPEVGPILVSGRTLGDVQQEIQRVLRTQFRDVSADVSLSRLRTVRVYVVGDVQNPGAYDISSLSTPLNALFASGGPTGNGSMRIVRHYRGKQLIEEVDLYDLLLHGIRGDMKRLEDGDTVQVPPLGPQITFTGTVRRPAIYELRSEKTLAEGLELAGGILPTAALRHIDVQRVEAHQKRTMLSLDIDGKGNPDEVNRQLQSFAIRDGDEVRIFPIEPYNRDAVYLQGHVVRPGKYSFHPGMKLTDLISSYSDLLPEPSAKYAEIIRLNAPDFRPAVESFDLEAALANPATAPKLQPLDTVRIFSRYDFEPPPTVSVVGEVQIPGTYRTSGQAHVRDAVFEAGGITPDGSLDSAQLIRSMPSGELKILSINLEKALGGDPTENVLLQPRDRLMIQRKPPTVDPPTVYIKGEVARPGRYPLTGNLRVEDLIRMSGGMKRSAYTDKADLTRFDPHSSNQLGEHQEIDIGSALAGDPANDVALRDGDVLTIRQLAGWNDIGASVSVGGEITHPGVYGISPGERLSSVLKRAGGFRTTAFPQGTVLLRHDVQVLQEKSRQELINRVEQDVSTVRVSLSETSSDAAQLQQAALQQHQRILEGLRNMPVSGRLVIRVGRDISKLQGTPDDIELRAGDALFVPKVPQFVAVTGQVYNSNAITFEPNRTVEWYLNRAGGPTNLADKKNIFVIRASGSVVSGKSEGWWTGKIGATRIQPGDTIVVPEKAIGGSAVWKNVVALANIAQAAALTAFIATR